MVETNQYSLNHRELLEVLVKHIGLHEGKWQLLFNISVATGSMGPTPEQSLPGVMVTIPNVGIQRLGPEVPLNLPGAIAVDAAEINPRK